MQADSQRGGVDLLGVRRERWPPADRGGAAAPGLPLRHDEGRGGATDRRLPARPRRSGRVPAVLHRVRPAAAAGHGLPTIRRCPRVRPAAAHLRQRSPVTRLHLRRRRRRRDDRGARGHLRRTLRMAVVLRRLRPDVEVLLATGAKGAERLVAAHGIACVHLPSVIKAGPGRYESTEPGAPSIDAVVARRSAILAETVTDFAPNILLVDRHPRGLHRELDAALDIHRSRRPPTRAVLGLRDILDEPETIKREWAQQELPPAIQAYYNTAPSYGH